MKPSSLCREVNRLSGVSIDGSHDEDIQFEIENETIFKNYGWIGVCVGYTL